MPVSEIEKLGVSTSGCHFSEKAQLVPIKKRRFLFRSPSPPPDTISPCTEESADHARTEDASEKLSPLPSSSDIKLNQIVDNDNSIDAKKSEKSSVRFGEDDDFSGISILAAAACSSSLGRDCGYMEDGSGIEESSVLERSHDLSIDTEARSSSKGMLNEGIFNSSEMSSGLTSSCIYTEPVGELASISSTVNSSQKVATAGKGVKEAFMGADSLTYSGDASFSKDEEIVRSQGISSRDVRLHWDLNVVMDAWEQPFDDLGAQDSVAHNTCHDAGKVNHNDNMESQGHDSKENQETLYVGQGYLLCGEPIASVDQSSGEMKDNHDTDACLNLEQPLCLNEKSHPSNSNLNLDVMSCMVEDTKCRHHQGTVNPIDGLVVGVPNQRTQSTASCTIGEAEDVSVKSVNLIDKGIGYQPVTEGSKSNVSGTSCELHDNAYASDANLDAVSADTHMSLCVSYSSDTPIEVKQNIAVPEDLGLAKICRWEENVIMENVYMKTVEPLELAKFSISDDDGGYPRNEAPDSVSKRCELLVALDTNVHDISNIEDGNNINNNESTKNLSEISQVICKDPSDSYFHDTGKTKMDICSNFTDNIDDGESFKHSNDVIVECHPVLVAGTDAAGKLQEDYDPQYEDGELRESSGRALDKYDAVDREAGNVDYVSNHKETYTANPNDYHVSDSGQVEDRISGKLGTGTAVSTHDWTNEIEVNRKAAEAVENDRGHDDGNQIELSNVGGKTELTHGEESIESCKSSSDMELCSVENDEKNNGTPSHIDGSIDSRGIETRVEPEAFRRGLQSQIEGPVARDYACREERLKNMEHRFGAGSIRSFERVRYPFQNQGRGCNSGSWDGPSDSHRGFRRHYSPITHRHSKLDDDDAVGRVDHGCVGTEDDVSYFQLPGRAGMEGDSCGGFQSREKVKRKFSPDRAGSFGRGRSFRYGPFVEGRGGRERYNGPSPDDGSSDSRRCLRSHYSSIVHGHSKLDDDAVVGRDDHRCVGTLDDAPYFQQLPKGRASAEEDSCAGFQLRNKVDRKCSPDRAGGFGRGRFFRYGPFVEGRGGRGRYNGPSPDESFYSSLNYRESLSCRERSLSPFRGRGQSNIQHSRRKSPPCSRSRSPIIWNSPRRRLGPGSGGNTFLRHRSRSPNFRTEARMHRPRSPQQQPGFGIDHAGGFRSISRNNCSPPRNQWISARKDELGHFREIGYKQQNSALDRSPGRIRLRDDRGRAVNSLRNLKPDGQYRFSDRISDDAGRGARYEESFEEKRKHYNLIRPARRNFDDGMSSRLHQDMNENFSMANSFRDREASSFQDRGFRSMDSRIGDESRRFRGDNHSFMYERDGKFNPNTNQHGVDAIDSSHNQKSEEQ
ncbi:hypothetical protein BVRB_5g100150 isoform A [Beta vulgaris subsp. vulgaris]|nr:uncharacterized protein LOC104892259 isoform X2 [Beta vulgaris subsp. vulgaris]KMT12056.1 hypothetical protein BVRB_5g100150 isoform A [Beta vulgaris subsp. vulgaris]